MPAISAACGTLHTYDVGLCQLLDSEDAGCGRPLDAEASKYSRPRLSLFKHLTYTESGEGYREIYSYEN